MGNTFEPDLVFNGVIVPFSAHGDASDCNLNKGRRIKLVQEFIGLDIPKLHTLDIGPPNAFGQLLGLSDNSIGDVNEGVKAPSVDYDLIVFSEIIEHLMNVLGPLRDCYRLLKPGGVLVVSTPIPNIIFYQSLHHLAEYRPDRLVQVFEYVGFKVEKYQKINIWDKRFAFYGVRPLLRVLFHRSQLWKLRKPL